MSASVHHNPQFEGANVFPSNPINEDSSVHRRRIFTLTQSKTMQRAIKQHKTDLILELFRAGFDPALPLTEDKWNAFLLLVIEGETHLVQSIVRSGDVDVDYQDEDGFTALMIAADKGDLSMVKTLVDLRCDLQITYDGKNTARVLALQSERGDVVTYLLDQERKQAT